MAVRLVPDELSTDLGECLDQLMRLYKAGKLRGLAFVGTIRGSDYFGNTAGISHNNPTLVRGQLLALDDMLARRVHGIE